MKTTKDGIPINENAHELIKYHDIDNNPFTIVELINEESETEKVYYVLFGKYRIHQDAFHDYDEAYKFATEFDWMKVTSVVGIMVKMFNDGLLSLDDDTKKVKDVNVSDHYDVNEELKNPEKE